MKKLIAFITILLFSAGVHAAEMKDYVTTDANNTARWPENMAPSAVNNAARANEGISARWYKDTNMTLLDHGPANSLKVTPNATISALFDGLVLGITVTSSNTGAVTLQLDEATTLTASVVKGGGDNTALAAGDIKAGDKILVVYDADSDVFQLITPARAPAAAEAGWDLNGQVLTLDADADTSMDAAVDDNVAFNIGGTANVISHTVTGTQILGISRTTGIGAHASGTTIGNVTISNGSIVTTSASDFDLDPAAGQSVVIDGALDIDGAIMGYTGAFTVTGAVTVDNLTVNGNTITASAGDLNLTPASGSAIVLDGTINVDAGVVTGATSITSTAFVGDLTGNASGTAATVTGAAQAAITSLGTLTTLTVDNITINGAAITSDTGAISLDDENVTTTGTLAAGATTITGTIGVTDSQGADLPLITATNTSAASYTQGFHAIFPNITAGPAAGGYIVGQDWSSKNAGRIGFIWNSSGSDSNALEFGFHSADGILLLYPTGAATLAGALTLTGGQIKFPATQVPSALANALDDFEQGTFTPTMLYGGSEVSSYHNQNARYMKIGEVVFFSIEVQVNSLGGQTGALTIGGLPFTPSSDSALRVAMAVSADNLAEAGTDTTVMGDINDTNVVIDLYEFDNGSMAALTHTTAPSPFHVIISGHYYTDL